MAALRSARAHFQPAAAKNLDWKTPLTPENETHKFRLTQIRNKYYSVMPETEHAKSRSKFADRKAKIKEDGDVQAVASDFK